MHLERRLKGWDQELKLVEGQTGEIQELCGAICTSVNRKCAIGGASCYGRRSIP